MMTRLTHLCFSCNFQDKQFMPPRQWAIWLTGVSRPRP